MQSCSFQTWTKLSLIIFPTFLEGSFRHLRVGKPSNRCLFSCIRIELECVLSGVISIILMSHLSTKKKGLYAKKR